MDAALLLLAGGGGAGGDREDKTVDVLLCCDADVTFHLIRFDVWYSHCHSYPLKKFIMKHFNHAKT